MSVRWGHPLRVRRRLLWAVRLLAVLALPLSALPASGLVPPVPLRGLLGAAPAWCGADGVLSAETLPPRIEPSACDLQGRIIDDHGVRLAVPPPGRLLAGEVIDNDGATQLFELRTLADGVVLLRDVGNERVRGHDSAAGGGHGPAACDDDAYELSEARDTDPHDWYFRASTTPAGLSVGAVAEDLLAGTNAVTSSHNDCGLADEVDAHQAYRGNTSRGSGINFEGTCPAQGDGQYTVDFGNLPEHTLARTCWRASMSAQGHYEITEADVKMRASAPLFTGAVPAGCRGARFSIRAIMAHEVGHVYGVRHVAEAHHPELTMSERTPSCSLDPVTLGLGDILALRALY